MGRKREKLRTGRKKASQTGRGDRRERKERKREDRERKRRRKKCFPFCPGGEMAGRGGRRRSRGAEGSREGEGYRRTREGKLTVPADGRYFRYELDGRREVRAFRRGGRVMTPAMVWTWTGAGSQLDVPYRDHHRADYSPGRGLKLGLPVSARRAGTSSRTTDSRRRCRNCGRTANTSTSAP